MRLNRKWKNTLLGFLVLLLLLLVSSMPAYGASARFKDVPKKEWYYQDVEAMAQLGYLQGKGNGLFDPEGNLTFMESMASFTRLTEPTSEERKNSKAQYSGLMKELNVKQEWEIEALSMALYKGIVSVNEVRNASKENQFHKPIQKVTAAAFLAKAVGLEDEANSLSVVFLEYKDVLKIKPLYRKYLKVLQDADILSVEGDGGNFNPTEALRRKIMATMLSKAHKYLEKNPLNNNTDNNSNNNNNDIEVPNTDQDRTVRVKGTVNRITNEIGRQFLVIDNIYGDEESYVLDKSTSIKVDGKTSSVASLKRGQEVTLEVNDRTRAVISLSSVSVEEDVDGVITYVSLLNNEIKLDQNIGGKVKSNSFDLDKNVKVKMDGRNSNLANLRNGDFVKLRLSNNKVYDIDGSSEEIKIRGHITEIKKVKDTRDNEYELVVKDKDREYKIMVDYKTYIDRDRKSSRPEDLRKGDDVYVIARYDVKKGMYLADDVDAKVVTEKVIGYVLEISTRLNKNPLVKIKNKDTNKEESYELVSGAYIRVDGKTVSTLPYNPGYEVELYVEGGRDIVEAYADSTGMESSIVGRIDYINTKDDYIEIEVHNMTTNVSENRYIRVYIESDTVISNRKLEKLDIKDLYRNDSVNVVGIYKGANFVADTIQIR